MSEQQDPRIVLPPTNNESIRVEGDYLIDKVQIIPGVGNPIDVTNSRITIILEEDIFKCVISGSISLSDSYDLTMLLPIVGEEKLVITFKRPGTVGKGDSTETQPELEETETYDKTFRIVSLTDRQKQREKQQFYILDFVSEESIKNHKVKVRKSYHKMLYSDMVKDIYDEFLNLGKPLIVEPTKYEQDLVSSNFTPFDIINIISVRSLSEKYVGSNYMFFESLDGYHFETLEKVFDSPPVDTWIYRISNIFNFNNDILTKKDIKSDVINVRGYEHTNNFNVLRNLISGMYASKLITYDLVRQIYTEIEYDLTKEFDKYKHCNDSKPFRIDTLDALGSPESRFNLMCTNKDHDIIPWIAAKEPGILPTHIEEYLQARQSQIQQINNYTISLVIPGNTERTVGQMIEFSLPNSMGDNERAAEPDKYLSGKWLITRLRHRIEKNSYWLDVDLVKDSFVENIVYEDPIPIYQNIW